MTFETSSDKRVNLLYKKYSRSASTVTASASVAGEATEMDSRGAVLVAADVYAAAIPDPAPATTASWTRSGDSVLAPGGGTVSVAAGASAAALAAAHGLTEDVWQAFVDGELTAAHEQSYAHVLKLERLRLRHVQSTANIETSPAFYHPCLFDALPGTAYGGAYPVEVTGAGAGGAEHSFSSTDDGAWVLQPEAGVLQFMDGAGTSGAHALFAADADPESPALFNLVKHPEVTFYRYVGPKLDEFLTYLALGDGAVATFGDGAGPRAYFASGSGNLEAVQGDLVIASTGPLDTGGDLQLGEGGPLLQAVAGGTVTVGGDALVTLGDTGLGVLQVSSTAAGLYNATASAWMLRAGPDSTVLSYAGADRVTTTASGVEVTGSLIGAGSIVIPNSEAADHVTGTAAGDFIVCYDKYYYSDSVYGLVELFDTGTPGGLMHHDGDRGWAAYYHDGNTDHLVAASLTTDAAKMAATSYGTSGNRKYLECTSTRPRGWAVDGNVALLQDAANGTGLYSLLEDRWLLDWTETESTLYGTSASTYARAEAAGVTCQPQVTVTGQLSVTGAMYHGGERVLTEAHVSAAALEGQSALFGTSYTEVASAGLTVPVAGEYMATCTGTMFVTPSSYSTSGKSAYDIAQNILLANGYTIQVRFTVGTLSVTRTTRLTNRTGLHSPLLPITLRGTLAAGAANAKVDVRWSATNSLSAKACVTSCTVVLVPAGSKVSVL